MTIISSGMRPASAIGQNNPQSTAGKTGLKPQHLNAFVMPAKQDVFFSGLGSKNKDIDKLDKNGFNKLHRVIVRSERGIRSVFYTDPLKELDEIIESGVDVNKPCSNGNSALMLLLDNWRIRSGNETEDVLRLAKLKCLLRAGANVNHSGVAGRTPLLSVPRMDAQLDIVKLLLKAGADVNQADSLGHTPLLRAVTQNVDIVRELLSAGAHVNQPSETGDTALLWAISPRRGDSGIVKELLKAGANVNQPNKAGITPLHKAVSKLTAYKPMDSILGYRSPVEDIKLLLDAGADLDMPDKEGHTPRDILVEKKLDGLLDKLKKSEKTQSNQQIQSDDSDSELARWNAEFHMPGGFGGLIAGSNSPKKKSEDEQGSLSRSSSFSRRAGKQPVTELDGRSIHELDARQHTPTPEELDGNQIHELLVEHPELDSNEIYELPTEHGHGASSSSSKVSSWFKKK